MGLLNDLNRHIDFLDKKDLVEQKIIFSIRRVTLVENQSFVGKDWHVEIYYVQEDGTYHNGIITFPAKTASRNERMQAIKDWIDMEGSYHNACLQSLPPRQKGYKPYYFLADAE